MKTYTKNTINCTPKYSYRPHLHTETLTAKKNTNIYLDETVTLTQYIKLTSALLCYDDVQLYDKLKKM